MSRGRALSSLERRNDVARFNARRKDYHSNERGKMQGKVPGASELGVQIRLPCRTRIAVPPKHRVTGNVSTSTVLYVAVSEI